MIGQVILVADDDASMRTVLSPQPVITCISTFVKLFQFETSEAAIWMFCAML